MFVCMYVCVFYVCRYVYMYVCMYVRMQRLVLKLTTMYICRDCRYMFSNTLRTFATILLKMFFLL